jgi:2-methylcitrate dehydratase PrpD
MIHPYIDCARRISLSLGRGSPTGSLSPGRGPGRGFDDIGAIECETAEGIVHRLWEPLAAKRRPANGYAAKFSIPYCVAYALVHGAVGLDAFDDGPIDPRVAALAAKVEYRVDPANPYPDEYTGHVRVRLADGRVLEERQPHLRGGHHEPLSRGDIEEKFLANCARGGWDEARSRAWLDFARRAFDGPIDLAPFRG